MGNVNWGAVTDQQPNQGPAPSPGDLLGAALGAFLPGGGVANVLGQIGYNTLQRPITGRAVRTALGGGSEEAFMKDNFLGEVLGKAVPGGPLGYQAREILKRVSPETEAEWMRFNQEGMTEPLNLFGFGIPGKIEQALLARNMIQAANVANFFQRAENLPGNFLAQAIGLPIKGVVSAANSPRTGFILKALGSPTVQETTRTTRPGAAIPGITASTLPVEEFHDVPAQSVGEYLGHLYRGADLQRVLRTLYNMMGTLEKRVGGLSFEDFVGEKPGVQFPAKAFAQVFPAGHKRAGWYTPGSTKAMVDQLQQREQGILDLIEQAGTVDPRAGVAGMELFSQLQAMNAEKVWGPLSLAHGLQNNAAQNYWRNTLFNPGYEQQMRVMTAAEKSIQEMTREARNWEPLEPTIQGWTEVAFRQGLDDARNIVQTRPVAGMFPTQYSKGTAPFQRLPVVQQRATDIESALETGMRAQMPQGLPATPPLSPGLDPARLRDLLERRHAGVILSESAGLPSFLPDLPLGYHGPAAQYMDDFKHYTSELMSTRQKFENAVKTMWERRMGPNVPYQEFKAGKFSQQGDFLDHMNNALQTMGMPKITGTVDFVEKVAPQWIPEHDLANLRDAIGKFPAGDILLESPSKLVFDRVGRKIAENMQIGGKDANKAIRLAQGLTTGFKEQALATINSVVTNMVGGLAMTALGKQDPVRAIEIATENFGKIASGDPWVPRMLDSALQATGKVMPIEGTARASGIMHQEAAQNEIRDFTKNQLSLLERIGPLKLGAAGLGVGTLAGLASSPKDASDQEKAQNIVTGGLQGAALGGILPVASKVLVRKAFQGVEDVLRMSIVEAEYLKGLANAKPMIEQLADAALNQQLTVVLPGKVPRGVPYQVSPQGMNHVHQVIDGTNGIMSANDLSALLIRVGVDPKEARVAASTWDAHLDKLLQAGVKESNRINFDYSQVNNIQQFADQILPFSKWAMKALPFFGENLVANPWLLMAVGRLEGESIREQEEAGLTSRTTGAIRPPGPLKNPVDAIWSAAFGHPVSTFFNPLRGFMPFSDSLRALQAPPNESPAAALLRAPRAAGLPGVNPLLETPLRATGLLGPEAPTRGIIRMAEPLQGAGAVAGINRGRGIDLNAPMETAEVALRSVNPLTKNYDVTDLDTVLTLRRLDEMAVRNTKHTIAEGGPAVAEYAAQAARRAGPLWDKAAAEVARDRGMQSMLGSVAGIMNPQTTVTREEMSMRGIRKEDPLKPDVINKIMSAVGQNPNQVMPPDVVAAVRNAALQMSDLKVAAGELQPGQLPPQAEQLLANPTAMNLRVIQQQITQELNRREPQRQMYGQSGSPEAQELQNMLTLYNSAAALFTDDAALKSMTPEARTKLIGEMGQFQKEYQQLSPSMQRIYGQTGAKAPLASIKARQDELRKQSDILDKYLDWRKGQGAAATVDEFLTWYRQHRGR